MEKALQHYYELFLNWLPQLGIALAILFGFMLLSKILRGLINKASERFKLDPHVTTLIARTVRITLYIFGIITALGTLGINVSALVAGLGLTGFALGFALKDTISNLLSGVMILLHRPFKIGDTISIAGFEGKVISIDMRYTVLDTEEGKTLIPNAKCFTDPIKVIDSTEE